ncbi:hypothetical protein H0H93_015051 [Arthromyces matolae]|nr:hypothetical protein H0H93_015051 [Arthromyces matolae]
MLRDRVTTSSGPWHIEGEWSTPVLRIMIQNLQNRRLRHIKLKPHIHSGSMVWEDYNPIKVAQMERTELVCVMDGLWTWARQTLTRLYKNRAVERSQATIHDIEIGKLKVEVIEVKKLIQAILGSVPEYDGWDPSKLPWHDGDNDVFRWKQAFRIFFVKKALPYMWLKMKNDRTTLTGEHPVSEEQQKILDGDSEELFNAMDKAWEKWVARGQRRLGSNNRYREQQRRKRVATDLPKIQ